MSRAIGIFNGNSKHAQYQREIDATKSAARIQFAEQWYTALERLKEIDPDLEEWFWSRSEQTKGEMLPLMEQRIVDLETALEVRRRLPRWIYGSDYELITDDEKLAMDIRAGVDVDRFLSLMDGLSSSWEFPWSAAEVRSEQDNHRPEVGF